MLTGEMTFEEFKLAAGHDMDAAEEGNLYSRGTACFYALHCVYPQLAVWISVHYCDPRGRNEVIDLFLEKAEELWDQKDDLPKMESFTYVEAIPQEPSDSQRRPAG